MDKKIFKSAEPTLSDKLSFARQNKACKARGVLDRISFSLVELNKDLSFIEKSISTATEFHTYVEAYIEGLEGGSPTAWFPFMGQTLAVLEGLQSLESESDRMRLEGVLIDSFLFEARRVTCPKKSC